MTVLQMVDSSHDLRPIIPTLRSQGYQPTIAAVYLDGGGAGAFVATPQYVSDLHGLGLAVLPVFNGAGVNGGSPGTAAQADADMNLCLSEVAKLGVPAGCYVAIDVEHSADGTLQGPYLAHVAERFRVTNLAGAGMVYATVADPAFGKAFDDALTIAPADVGRMVFWYAHPVGRTGPLPAWNNPGGVASVPWSSTHRAQIVGWQCLWLPAVDFSLVRIPLPAYGQEGLWLPEKVGQPAAPPMDISGALGSVAQAQSELAKARAQLGG